MAIRRSNRGSRISHNTYVPALWWLKNRKRWRRRNKLARVARRVERRNRKH